MRSEKTINYSVCQCFSFRRNINPNPAINLLDAQIIMKFRRMNSVKDSHALNFNKFNQSELLVRQNSRLAQHFLLLILSEYKYKLLETFSRASLFCGHFTLLAS